MDRAINPDLERFMTKRAVSKIVVINSGRVIYALYLDEVGKLIEQAASVTKK